MPLDTYENLKLEIEAHLDRDDLTAQVDTFIDLAESRHRREVRIRQMLVRSALTVDDRYVDLPADFLQAKLLRLLTDADGNDILGRGRLLTEVTPFELTKVRVDTVQRRPCFFTIHSQLEFDADPDQAYGGELLYFQAPPALGDSVATNVILTEAPELYLYAALAAAEPFLAHDERLQTWAQLYADARDRLNEMAIKQQRAGPLVPRVSGGTP